MKKLTRVHWLLMAVIVAATFSLIAVYIYNIETEQTRKEKIAYLDAIANLKVDQITKWRTERLSEANFFPSDEKVIKSTIVLSINKNDRVSQQYLYESLKPIQQRHSYQDIFITDLNHNIIYSLNKEFSLIDTLTINAIHESFLKDSIIFTDFYYCKTHSVIHIDIVSPIRNSGKVIGAMVFRFDPREYIYPLIQKWPTPSGTAECTILREEDSLIRILNDVRFKENAALSLFIPKDDTDYVAVKAFKSNNKVIEGLDYRRHKVLASVRKIDGTQWLLISKMDQEEIFGDIRYKAGAITLITLIAFLLFSVLMMFLYKNRQSQVYKDLFFKEKELNDSQAQTKAITDAAQDAIVMMDENGNISFWNPAAEKILGYAFDEARDKNLNSLLAPTSIHSQHQNAFEKFKHSGKGNAVGSILAFNAIKKDKTEIPIELSLSALQLNKKWNSVGVIRDVSERKKSEAQLIESEEKFRKAFNTNPDTINITRIKDGMYVSINEGFKKLSGYTDEEVLGKTAYDINIWYNIEDRNKLVKQLQENGVVNNLEAKFRMKDRSIIDGLMSASVIQLNGEPHILSITRDITERKKIEIERIESEKNYHQMINGMRDAVYVINFEGKFIDVNDSASEMLGYSRDELVKLSPFAIDDTLTVKQIEQLIARMPTEKLQTFQTTHITKQKKRIPVEITSTLINFNGENAILSVAKDITPWINAQEKIYKSESLLNETQRLAKVGGWEYDIELNKIYWTNECYRIHGINQFEVLDKPDEYISKSIECYNDTDKAIVMLTFNRCIKEGIPYDLEFQFTNFKNEKLWIRTIAEPVYYGNKIVKVIGNIIDITERVDVMDKLRRSEKRFRELFESMEEGFYLTELLYDENNKPVDCRYIDVNPVHSRLTNLQRHEVIGKTLNELFPGLEKIWFDAHFEVAIMGKPKTLEGFVGSLNRYFLLRMYSPSQNQCAVIFSDITERKLAEQKLKESEERYSRIVNTANEGIWMMDAEHKTTYVNSRMCNMLGFDEKEIIGKKVEDFMLPEDLPGHYERMKVRHKGESSTYEHRFLTKDCNIIHTIVSGVSLKDKEGKFIGSFGMFTDITLRKNAEEALKQSESKFYSLFENSPNAIFISDPETYTIIDCNQNACLMNGYTKNELIGQSLTILHPEEIGSIFVKPETRELNLKILKDRKSITVESFHKRKNGTTFPIESSITLITLNGKEVTMGIDRDITERRKAEQALLESEEKYRNLIEVFQDAVFVNKKGTIVFVNPACIKLFGGESASDIIGKSPFDFFHPDNHKIISSRIKEMLKTFKSVSTIEEKIINLKGDTIDVEVSATPFKLDGVTAIQVVLKDITTRKIIERELDEYRNNLEEIVKIRTKEIEWINKELISEIEKKKQTEVLLQQSLDKEKELNQLKSRFISTASHEFRTPLTTILSSAELIQRYGKKWEEEKYTDHLNRITNSVEYLTTLMDDVLTISRIESGRVNFVPADVDLKDICNKVIADMKMTNNERHQLSFKFLSKETIFFLDSKQIQMIIQNLLSNSYKYSDAGNNIELTIQANEDSLQIKVADNGYGISEEDLPHLFEPFYRSLNTESIQGTGLGLAIVKNAVEMHGGTIAVNSKLGKGATFIITIPLDKNEKNTGS